MSENTPKDFKEAYLQGIQAEIIMMRDDITHIYSECEMRVGITQNIIDEQLKKGNEALSLYTKAANMHFTAQKEEIRDIARKDIQKAIVGAHRELLKSNPPTMSLNNILASILISATVSGIFGFLAGIVTLRFF